MRITFDAARVLHDPLPGTPHAGADATLYALDADGVARARCGLWWKTDLHFRQRRVGRIGAYAAACDRAAVVLLDAAQQRLRLEGCALAVGPMDGTTWDRYRFAVEGDRAPFVLEPVQPRPYVAQWERAGFRVAAHYHSTEGAVQPGTQPNAVRSLGLRPLDLTRLDDELRALHALSLRSFAHAPFFAPIGADAFVARYRALLPHLDTDLVLMAESGDRLVGVAFALPDVLEIPVETVVLKTLAVDPAWFGHGVGRWLVREVEARASEKGYRRVVHALMHAANPSNAIGDGHRLVRRYALYARELA